MSIKGINADQRDSPDCFLVTRKNGEIKERTLSLRYYLLSIMYTLLFLGEIYLLVLYT